jgi:hypothetical protein
MLLSVACSCYYEITVPIVIAFPSNLLEFRVSKSDHRSRRWNQRIEKEYDVILHVYRVFRNGQRSNGTSRPSRYFFPFFYTNKQTNKQQNQERNQPLLSTLEAFVSISISITIALKFEIQCNQQCNSLDIRPCH